MATNINRIQVIGVTLPAKAGSLFQIYSNFKEKGVDVLAAWAYEMGPGNAQSHFYCKDLERAKVALMALGFKPSIEPAVHVETEDRLGVFAELLHRISKARLSVNATSAMSVGGKFACVFFVDPKEYQGLCKALGC